MSLIDNAAVNWIRTEKKSYPLIESNEEVRYGIISNNGILRRGKR
jgi:hypothetical protein